MALVVVCLIAARCWRRGPFPSSVGPAGAPCVSAWRLFVSPPDAPGRGEGAAKLARASRGQRRLGRRSSASLVARFRGGARRRTNPGRPGHALPPAAPSRPWWSPGSCSRSPGRAAGVAARPRTVGVRAFVRSRGARRSGALFADQLADNLQVIASAQRAGHSFLGALAVSIEEAPEPTKREFERVLADERLGSRSRRDSTVRRRAHAVARPPAGDPGGNLQRETGGNTAEVLEGSQRRPVSAASSGAWWRASRSRAGVALDRDDASPGPAVLVGMLNPGYMEPLFETNGGRMAWRSPGFCS